MTPNTNLPWRIKLLIEQQKVCKQEQVLQVLESLP